MSHEIHVAIQELEKKLAQLLKRYKDQKVTIQKLHKECKRLKQQITSENNQAYSFLKQREELATKIDSYIQAIDNCIIYLE